MGAVPSAIRSTGNHLFVDFKTGALSSSTGFTGTFTTASPGELSLLDLTPRSGNSEGSSLIEITGLALSVGRGLALGVVLVGRGLALGVVFVGRGLALGVVLLGRGLALGVVLVGRGLALGVV